MYERTFGRKIEEAQAEKLKEELISKYSANITLIKANVKIEQDVIKLKNEVYKKYKKTKAKIDEIKDENLRKLVYEVLK